jgi:hypothetical protein
MEGLFEPLFHNCKRTAEKSETTPNVSVVFERELLKTM